jgi:hypothetical protein
MNTKQRKALLSAVSEIQSAHLKRTLITMAAGWVIGGIVIPLLIVCFLLQS